ncbi:hypothetical protein [Streptomyces mobaraensis]|uniref:Uncharacterized protein n=1 Tax=Streptomyces mobaraensis (strain ATCC 29032 / DSM 40847 / JCM 4168 / NBRC 13819 / NCIMB 11159 / IPCR 16-22) TaxID=1223523 RepID=M3C4H8_STRM1|nr:hypothetical protein [Streptomyces mobaraensis]EME98856.1 hypothetical protein H340_19373 [Streptomyces mobaraensis NBRC 13819 = DSM 40847]
MTAFLLGILSSLAASATLLVVGLLRGSRPLWWVVSVCSRWTGTGLGRVYRRQSSAEQDITHDLRRARWVKVLAGRGNLLTREAFTPLWSGELAPEFVRVLLPDPDTRGDSWLDRRSRDLCRFDPGYSPGLLRSQIRTNTEYVAQVTRGLRHVELRSFDLPHTCRVIATDRAAYLTFYSSSAHGRNSPCLYVQAPGLLYSIALQQFDTAWTNGSRAHPAPGP